MDLLHAQMVEAGYLRRRKADVLKDLPSKTHAVVPLEISHREVYERAEKEFIAWLHQYHGAEIRRRIMELKLDYGVTQKLIALESGVNEVMLCRILSGKRKGYEHRKAILKTVETLEKQEAGKAARMGG